MTEDCSHPTIVEIADDQEMCTECGYIFENVNSNSCLECGSQMEWVDCYSCFGEGSFDSDDLMEDDPLWYDVVDSED